ncbi:MAG: hypothetical protein M1817_001168 [Caeruleum heppii]|nr:MAG: hypothetical protein M1817_001168 [Caeruleum heppii]
MSAIPSTSTTPPSPILRLPPEILQTIFLLSSSLSFPLTSRELSSALSNKHVYTSFCLEAFPTSLKLESDVPDKGEADFQSAILRQPWLTLDVWRSIDDAWLRREEENARTQPTPHIRDSIVVHRDTQIPLRLLREPFTKDNLTLLDSIIGSGAKVDREQNPTTAEVAQVSALAAVRANDAPTFMALCVPATGVTPDITFLQAAVIEGGCNEAIVESLLDYTSEDYLDPAIWAWAYDDQSVGGKKGEWLIALLKERQYRRLANVIGCTAKGMKLDFPKRKRKMQRKA